MPSQRTAQLTRLYAAGGCQISAMLTAEAKAALYALKAATGETTDKLLARLLTTEATRTNINP